MQNPMQKPAPRRSAWLAALCLSLAAGQSLAAEIIVDIRNTGEAQGRVYVALCGERNFMRGQCDYEVARRATDGRTVVSFAGVLPGDYAIAAFYDLNGNQKLDKNLWGASKEPVAVSNHVNAKQAVPEFAAARITVAAGQRLRLELALL